MSPQGGQFGAEPPGPPRKMSTGRKVLCITLSVVGVLTLLGGGGIVAQMISNASQVTSNNMEYAPVMWRNERADKLFPKTLSTIVDGQTTADDPKHAEWNRLGIAQETSCREGLDGALAAEAEKLGCKAVVRATYVDPTGDVVGTLAYLVLDDLKDPGEDISKVFESGKPGVRAHPVPRTPAARWTDAKRNGSSGEHSNFKYAPFTVAATVGAVDGRKSGRLPEEWDFSNTSDRRTWDEAAEALALTGHRHLNSRLEDIDGGPEVR